MKPYVERDFVITDVVQLRGEAITGRIHTWDYDFLTVGPIRARCWKVKVDDVMFFGKIIRLKSDYLVARSREPKEGTIYFTVLC